MALTPESKRALRDAISTIVREAGDDPEFKDLLGTLESVRSDLGGPDADAPKEERDGEDDPYSFETAQKRHRERTAAKADAERESAREDATDKEGEDK